MKRLAAAIVLALAAIAAGAQTTSELLSRYSFSWGAQIGGSIDMSAQNMSTIDFTVTAGMRHAWIKMLGVGTGAHIMVSNSCRTYPIFAAFRTDFSSTRRRLLFMDTRLGIAANSFPAEVNHTGFYGYGGLGINLATGVKFASFISIGYTFVERGTISHGDTSSYLPHIHFASVSLGVHF